MSRNELSQGNPIAPPAGARIETSTNARIPGMDFIAPPAGARIETRESLETAVLATIAPPAGARIETGQEYEEPEDGSDRSPCGSAD